MEPLELLELILTILIMFQLTMILVANRVRKEWITVGQLSITTVIVAVISSILLFLHHMSIMLIIILVLQLIILPILWMELKTFEN